MSNKKTDPLIGRSKETLITSGVFYGFLVWGFVINNALMLYFNRDRVKLSMYLKKIEPISINSDHDAIIFSFKDTIQKPLKLKLDQLKSLVITSDTELYHNDTILNTSKLIRTSASIKSGFIYVGSLGATYHLEITHSDYKKLPALYRKETGILFKKGMKPLPKDIKVYVNKDGKGSDNKDTVDSIIKTEIKKQQ